MPDDTIKRGDDEVNVEVKVVGWPDRPGIAAAYVGRTMVFDGSNIRASELTVKVKLPFHIHFVEPEMGLSFAWREE